MKSTGAGMRVILNVSKVLWAISVPVWIFGASAYSADTDSQGQAPSEAKKVEVDSLKKQFWLNTPGVDLNVVQNRVYTKAWKFNFEAMGGPFSGDPFVNSWVYGAQLGYNFGEYLGFHAMYWKIASSFNSAYTTLVNATTTSSSPGYGSNSNQMQSMVGGEMSWSLLYGKLSLLGKAIIHFDLFVIAGGGILKANTGATQGEQSFSTFSYWPGIGQQFYVTPWMALRADYRMMIYGEDVVESNQPATMGNVLSHKTTYAPTFTVGLNFFFL